MTAGTKAHREGRAAQQATQQATTTDQVATVPAAELVTVTEAPAVIAQLMHGWTTAELARDVQTLARDAVEARTAGNGGKALITATQVVMRSVALVMRTGELDQVPAAYRAMVAAVLAGDQGDQVATVPAGDQGDAPAPAAVRWVVKGTNRTVTNPSQVDIVRGHVVRAPAGDQGDAPAGDVESMTSENENDLSFVAVPAPAGDLEGTNMRATVNRADLVAALTYAGKGIPSRPSVPALSGVVITVSGDVLTAHTFDWDTYRAGEAPAVDTVAGRIVVGGKTTLATVKAMSGKRVTLTESGADLTVSDEITSVTLPLMPVEDMPAVPADVHLIGTMDAGELARHVAAVAGAAGTDWTLPMVMAVRVRTDGSRIEFASTDRFRLHMSSGTWSPAPDGADHLVAPASEYLPPAKLLADVTSLFVRRAGKRPATVSILAGTFGGNPTYGMVSGGYRMITRSYIDAPYPPVEKLFTDAPAGTIAVDAADLVDKITQVRGGEKAKTPGNVIILPDVPAGTVTLEFWEHAGSDDAPAGTVTMPATFTGDVPAQSAFTPAFLADAVAPFTGTVRLHTVSARRPFVITGDSAPDARNLVMPVRITGRENAPNVSATAPAAPVPAAVPAVEAPAPAVESVDQGDTVPAATDAVSVPAVRPVIDGRTALAGAIVGPVRESSAVAILPAGALAAVTTDPRPRDFDAYRDQIGMCECPLCTELAYHAHHWCDKRDQVHAARVLLAHLVAGTHTRMTLAERGAEARAHREWLVGQAEAEGKTGEALDRVKHPDVYMRLEARAAVKDDMINGIGLGMTPGGVLGTPRSRAYWTQKNAERLARKAEVEAPAAVPAVEAPAAPAVESGDQGDALAGMVREIIAGATWSYGTGRIGGGKRGGGTRFHGPIMHPALPDRRLTRDEWTALADQVHALSGGAWMRDVKGFACIAGDVGNPWKKATMSTRERVAEWLAGDQGDAPAAPVPAAVPAVEAPAPAVESVDQGDTVPAAPAPVKVPAQRKARDPRRVLTAVLRRRRAHPGTEVHVSVTDSGVVSCKGARPTDAEVSDAFGRRYAFTAEVPGIVGTYYRFAPVDQGAAPAPAAVPAVEAPASVDQGDTVPAGETVPSVDQVPTIGHPLAIDPSKPVTVTLVYKAESVDQGDAPAAPAAVPAVEAPAGDTHGAHAQRVHVAEIGELNGYRFHLVAGVGGRQFGKPIRRALAGQFGRDAFSVTTPSGSGAVNVAARGDIADWSPVLALVAGIIGGKIAGDGATCAACDRSHALADH